MEFKRFTLRLSAAFFALSILSCGKAPENYGPSSWEPKPVVPEPETETVRTMPNVDSLLRATRHISTVHDAYTYEICKGVRETDMSVTLRTGEKANIYVTVGDLEEEGIRLVLAMPDNITATPATWPFRKLSEMAPTLESATSGVAAMINADFWSTSTFIPRGPVISNSYTLKTTFEPLGSGKQGVSFVGVGENGMVIEPSDKFNSAKGSLSQAGGSGLHLVKDGERVDQSSGPDTDREPRTAIGYTADNYVYFFTVDGRGAGGSEGMTLNDMGYILDGLKCKEAVNLDGGGSAQMLRRIAAGSFEISNRPSDGSERAVVEAWALMHDKAADEDPLESITIGDFACEFVRLLDIWESHTGTIASDNSHQGANAHTNVHFIPFYSSAMEGSDNNNYLEPVIRLKGRTFSLNEIWELAATGIVNLITTEGTSVLPSSAGSFVHTLGNGAGMDAVLPAPSGIPFGSLPWNEESGDLNLSASNPATTEFLAHLLPWLLSYAKSNGNIPNYCSTGNLGVNGFTGRMCSMRVLLIMARFYEQILKGGVSSNVYTYMKDRTVDPTLY